MVGVPSGFAFFCCFFLLGLCACCTSGIDADFHGYVHHRFASMEMELNDILFNIVFDGSVVNQRLIFNHFVFCCGSQNCVQSQFIVPFVEIFLLFLLSQSLLILVLWHGGCCCCHVVYAHSILPKFIDFPSFSTLFCALQFCCSCMGMSVPFELLPIH